jgi:hypothetical protein
MANNSILLRPFSNNQEEALASVEVKPGHLLARDSDGKFKPHDSAGGYAERLFAKEDDLQGNTTADAYAIGDRVIAYHALPGDEIQVLYTASEDIAIGDLLESAGDGTLREITSGVAVAVATQAIASAVADTLYKARVL